MRLEENEIVVTTGWQRAELGMGHYSVHQVSEEEVPENAWPILRCEKGRIYTELDMESFEQGFRIERQFQIR
jgi:hypothetical protein